MQPLKPVLHITGLGVSIQLRGASQERLQPPIQSNQEITRAPVEDNNLHTNEKITQRNVRMPLTIVITRQTPATDLQPQTG